VTVDDRYLGVSNSGFQFAKRIPLAEYDAVVVPGRPLCSSSHLRQAWKRRKIAFRDDAGMCTSGRITRCDT
jgi:hypothetical protein